MITLLLLLGALALLLLNVVLLLCIKTMRMRIHRELEEEKAALAYDIPPSLIGAPHGNL